MGSLKRDHGHVDGLIRTLRAHDHVFSQSFPAGLIPGGGGLARLVRVVGTGRAKELVYSGRFVDAEEAAALGLVDALVAPDGVYDAAAAWAQRFVDAPPAALAAVKAVIDGGVAARPKHIADERRRYVEVFAASQSGVGNR